MSRFTSKIAITIYILIAFGLTTGGYFVLKNPTREITITPQPQSADGDDISPFFPSADIPNGDDLMTGNNPDNNPTADTSEPINADNATEAGAGQDIDTDAPKISATPKISGSMLARINPEHCDSNCQSFAIDLKLFEYCQQACGISPVKKVDNCDGKDGVHPSLASDRLQKDYCLKDLAIGKSDIKTCDDIDDANIKQACKNRIEQDAFENLNQGERQPDPNL